MTYTVTFRSGPLILDVRVQSRTEASARRRAVTLANQASAEMALMDSFHPAPSAATSIRLARVRFAAKHIVDVYVQPCRHSRRRRYLLT